MNAILPNSTMIGPLELTEMFDYYDGPLLFACRNPVGQSFLGMWVGSIGETKRYWLVSVSKSRFLMIRSGGLGLSRAFLEPELGFVYQCTLHIDTGLTDLEVLLPDRLNYDLLPDKDEFLHIPTDTLTDRFDDGFARKAVAYKRELIGLHFHFPGYREEAPTKQLGKIMVSIQETLDALGQGIGGNATMRGVIAPDILAQTETRLIQAAGGSFALEISAAQAVDLFGSSLITEALSEFVDLLEIGNEVEKLREKLFAIKPRAASKYKVFLASLLNADSPLHLEWASPEPARNRSVDLSLVTAAGALQTAEQVTSEIGETRTGIGLFVGVELPRRAFTAVLDGDENIYRGRIADTAMPEAEHVTLNLRYRITIRETIEVTTSGEEKPKYQLEAISALETAN
jgi:hypothetical protein